MAELLLPSSPSSSPSLLYPSFLSNPLTLSERLLHLHLEVLFPSSSSFGPAHAKRQTSSHTHVLSHRPRQTLQHHRSQGGGADPSEGAEWGAVHHLQPDQPHGSNSPLGRGEGDLG